MSNLIIENDEPRFHFRKLQASPTNNGYYYVHFGRAARCAQNGSVPGSSGIARLGGRSAAVGNLPAPIGCRSLDDCGSVAGHSQSLATMLFAVAGTPVKVHFGSDVAVVKVRTTRGDAQYLVYLGYPAYRKCVAALVPHRPSLPLVHQQHRAPDPLRAP
jgi:hypothetical protein